PLQGDCGMRSLRSERSHRTCATPVRKSAAPHGRSRDMSDSQFTRTNSETCTEEPDNIADHGFHAFSELFPLMDETALEKLTDDIRKHGLREAIVQHEGQILDGRNRYLACQRAGIEPEYRVFKGADPIEYVVSANLHRRHLNESQRAMVAEKLANRRQ